MLLNQTSGLKSNEGMNGESWYMDDEWSWIMNDDE